jgi:hypothetical protein
MLENRADFHRKLFAAVAALEHRPRADFADVLARALWADGISVRPFQVSHVGVAHRQVREIPDGGDK